MWGWWQIISAVLCVFGVLVLEPFMKLAERRGEAGRQIKGMMVGNGSAGDGNGNGRKM